MPTLHIIDTTREIRSSAAAWDDLWRRSGTVLPTRRAAVLANWIDQFAPGGSLQVLVVEDCGKFVAALPLVSKRLARVLPAATLPVNCWTSAGDLLLDPGCDQQAVLSQLIEGIRSMRWPLLWFDTIEVNEPRWIAFGTACRRAGWPIEHRVQFDLGLIDVGDEWDEYRCRWSKNLRRDIARRLRKAEQQGDLRFEVYSDLAEDEVEPLLVSGFEVEDRSWKGPAGTSVLRSPGMLEFYVYQAEQLAELGQLQLSFLRLDGWPIAFELGYQAEGVHFSHKAGYDEAYRDLAPGQLLMMKLLERSHHDPEVYLHNCMGMLTPAVAKWCTRVRPIGRMVVGTGGPVGSAAMLAYGRFWPLARRVRAWFNGRNDDQPTVVPGCAGEFESASKPPTAAVAE